nr:stefin 1_2 [Myxidium lieberkuehni]
MSNPLDGYCNMREVDEESKHVFMKATISICQHYVSEYDHFSTCKLKGYKKKIVKGTNYLLKVEFQKEEAQKTLWCKVFQSLPCYGGNIEYKGLNEDETRASQID